MKILAYRITKRRFAATIWSGVGAKERGGRWNSKGVAVVYVSESRALAAMEQLVHLVPPRVLGGYIISSVKFDERQVERLEIRNLPTGWDRTAPPAALRKIGDQWVTEGRSVALAVPSAVVRGEWNYLLNPAHDEFDALPKSTTLPFVFDQRLR